MQLEDRQLALESEMNTAKDTIWRLTNRIFNLEQEVGELKKVITSVHRGHLGTIQSNASARKIASAAKLAEIARHRHKCDQRIPKEASKSNMKTVNVDTIQLDVKEEPISDTEEMNTENTEHHFLFDISEPRLQPNCTMPTAKAKFHRKRKQNQSSESSDYDSEDGDGIKSIQNSIAKYQRVLGNTSTYKERPPMMGQKRNTFSQSTTANRSKTVGRKKGPIWKFFEDSIITNSKGVQRGVAICKKCGKHVDKKTDRMSSHLTKCSPGESQRDNANAPVPLVLSSNPICVHDSEITPHKGDEDDNVINSGKETLSISNIRSRSDECDIENTIDKRGAT